MGSKTPRGVAFCVGSSTLKQPWAKSISAPAINTTHASQATSEVPFSLFHFTDTSLAVDSGLSPEFLMFQYFHLWHSCCFLPPFPPVFVFYPRICCAHICICVCFFTLYFSFRSPSLSYRTRHFTKLHLGSLLRTAQGHHSTEARSCPQKHSQSQLNSTSVKTRFSQSLNKHNYITAQFPVAKATVFYRNSPVLFCKFQVKDTLDISNQATITDDKYQNTQINLLWFSTFLTHCPYFTYTTKSTN